MSGAAPKSSPLVPGGHIVTVRHSQVPVGTCRGRGAASWPAKTPHFTAMQNVMISICMPCTSTCVPYSPASLDSYGRCKKAACHEKRSGGAYGALPLAARKGPQVQWASTDAETTRTAAHTTWISHIQAPKPAASMHAASVLGGATDISMHPQIDNAVRIRADTPNTGTPGKRRPACEHRLCATICISI